MKIAMSGCFDLLHEGHKDIIKRAIDLAGKDGELYILVNTDESIKKLKGKNRPKEIFGKRWYALFQFINENILLKCKAFNFNIIEFNTEADLLQSYRVINPDIILHGSDIKNTNKITGYKMWPILLVPKLEDKNGNIISTTSNIGKIDE